MVIGFIGAGKMARALASGLVRAGIVPATSVICSSRSAASGQALLAAMPNIGWTTDNLIAMQKGDPVVLAVKPQQFAGVLPPLREASAGKLILSIAAGLTLEKIAAWLHPEARLVRAMPNAPMQIGLGASVYALGRNATPADEALVQHILSAAGQAWRVEEKQIDAITALSGSGPAYVFHFIDALLRGAIALGIPEELARALTLQTVLGSAQLAAQSPLSPLDLAAQVKSPRGTTLAGCAVLEENAALNDLVARCLAAAKARAEELAREKE
jgi:pyrroline-5-carboxylate reductase